MKYWLALAVIAVHVALLAFLFGPWRKSGPSQDPASAAGSAGTPSGSPSTATAGTPGTTSVASTANPAPGSPVSSQDPYSPAYFRRALRPLPPKLEAASGGCRTGVAVDWSNRSLLWAKAETRAVPIASLTKMMPLFVVADELEPHHDLSLTTPVSVTREAALIGGRQVWLDPRETFPLQDIMRAALIHSANDAAFLLAQRLAGSEEAFVRRMQESAARLGLTSFEFNNSHGLPEGRTQRENLGSAIELAYLAGRLLAFPKVVEWSSTRLSYLEPRVDGKKTQLVNTNHLVSRVRGVNGMKTGFTDKSGYCLTATCERQGRQIIVVATGCAQGTARDQLVTDLIEWAYATP